MAMVPLFTILAVRDYSTILIVPKRLPLLITANTWTNKNAVNGPAPRAGHSMNMLTDNVLSLSPTSTHLYLPLTGPLL